MNLVKSRLFSFLLMIFLLFVACSDAGRKVPDGMKSYDGLYFSVCYPEAMEILEASSIFVFGAAEMEMTHGMRSNLDIVSEKLIGDQTLDMYVESMLEQYADNDCEVYDHTKVLREDGVEYVFLAFTAETKEVHYTSYQGVYINKEAVYLVTYSMGGSPSEQGSREADVIMNSFVLK